MDVVKLDIFENVSSENKSSLSNNNKKKSLFYQKFKSLKGSNKINNPTPENVIDLADIESTSHEVNENVVFSTSQDVDIKEIENENIQKINSYSSSEIKSLLSEVFSTLKPEQIEFLKTRAKKKIVTKDLNKPVDLEEEKTKWMKPIEEVTAPSKRTLIDGDKYRFDFEGRILSYPDNNMNIKLNEILPDEEEKVLLHHGDEPSSPGYTIDELIHLSRSTFKAQRNPALKALKNIIYKAKRWLYKIPKENQEIYYVNTILLTHILNDGKLFIVLRQLIDESNLSTLSTTFEVLHALITNDCDEKVYSLVRRSWKGYESYPLYVYNKFEGKMEEETTDIEKVQLDLVLGYVSINFLERVRYILEVLNPSVNIIKNILEIILRFSRHSAEVSEEIVKCPRFLYVLKSFLNHEDKRIVYLTIKIIHALCQSSRVACKFCIKEELISMLVQYFIPIKDISEEKTDMNIKIAIESLYTWEACLRYGLNIESTLNYLQMFTDMMKSNAYPSVKLIKSAILRIFEAMTELAINLKENEPIPKGKILWSVISPLFHQALQILKNSSSIEDIDEHYYKSSAGHLISTYIERILNTQGFELDEERFQIQKIGHTIILPYLLSSYFSDLLSYCMNEEFWDENSDKNDILNVDKYCVSMVNHPSLSWKSQFFRQSTSYKGITLSVLMNNLLSMLRVINIIGQIDPLFGATLTASEIAGPLQVILKNYSTHAMKYSSSKPFLYCSRIIHYSAYYLIKLLYHQSSIAQDASLICLGCLLPGDVEMAIYLVTRVIFFSHEDDPTFDLSNLNLQPKLVTFYYNLLNEENKNFSEADPSSKPSLNLLLDKSSMPLGKTWPYLPIIHYKEFIHSDKDGKISIKQGTSFVRDALIFIKNLEETSGGYTNKIKRSTKLYTIMNCFLLSHDIFSDEQVKSLLENLFNAYIDKGWEPVNLSFSINVELLKNVINAWANESYGDKTLGYFIVAWSLAGACLTEKQIEQSKHKEDLKSLENELWIEIEKLWHLLPDPPKNLEKYFYDVGMRRSSLIPHYIKCLKSPHITTEVGKQSIYPQIFISNIETYLSDPNVNQFEKMYTKKMIVDNEISMINI